MSNNTPPQLFVPDLSLPKLEVPNVYLPRNLTSNNADDNNNDNNNNNVGGNRNSGGDANSLTSYSQSRLRSLSQRKSVTPASSLLPLFSSFSDNGQNGPMERSSLSHVHLVESSDRTFTTYLPNKNNGTFTTSESNLARPLSISIYVQENGNMITMLSSLNVQFQADIAKVVDDKLNTYITAITAQNNSKQQAREIEQATNSLFHNLFSFRKSQFYLRYLQLIDACSTSCMDTLIQFLLQWLPSNLFVVKIKTKRQVKFIPMQVGGKVVPLWSFDGWINQISHYGLNNDIHKQVAECVAHIAFADIMAVMLKHYKENIFRKEFLDQIIDICFTVFYHKEERGLTLPSWAALGNAIFDQYAYLIRRLSIHDPKLIFDVCKERIPTGKSTVGKHDVRFGLEGIRFIDIDISQEYRTEIISNFLEYLVQLGETYKKSIKVRTALMNVFINVMQQLDFEIQFEARLFETFVDAFYGYAEQWSKKSDLKLVCLRLMTVITVHYLLPFHEKHAEKLLKSLLKSVKKEDLSMVINTIGTLLHDKFRINKNIDLRYGLGPAATGLEKDAAFGAIVYAERDKNVLGFDEDVLSNKNVQRKNQGTQEAQFARDLSSYKTRMLNLINTVQKEFFDGKKIPILNNNLEVFEESIAEYTRIILRIAVISLETVLNTTIPALLKDKSAKSPEMYVLAFKVIKLLCSAGNEKSHPPYVHDELVAIKRNPNYIKLIVDFQTSTMIKMQNVLRNVCEPAVGIDVVSKLPNPLYVYSYLTDRPQDAAVDTFDNLDEEVEQLDGTEFDSEVIDGTFSDAGSIITSSVTSSTRSVSRLTARTALFEQSSVKSRSATELSKVLKRQYPSLTNVSEKKLKELTERHEKNKRRRYASAVKAKKDKITTVHLLNEIIKCLPYMVNEQLLAPSDLNKFLGRYLVYNDTRVATSCSHSLQQLVKERENFRHSILDALSQLFLKKEFRDDVPSFATLLDNISIMLDLWRQTNIEAIQNLKAVNMNNGEINNYLKSTWNTAKLWIHNIEAVCLASLCFYETNVRKSALDLLEVVHSFLYSEGLEDAKHPTTVFEILRDHEHDIVQQALLRVSLDDVYYVETEIDASLLHDQPSIRSLSQKEDSHVLWSYIVSMIGQTLTEFGSMNTVSQLHKFLIERIKDFPNLTESEHTYHEPFAFLWSSTISLLFASAGVQDISSEEQIHLLHTLQTESAGIVSSLNIFNVNTSPSLPWVSLAISNAAFCINYQFILSFLKVVNDWLAKSTKSIRGKPDRKAILFLHDLSKIMCKLSHCSQLHKAFALKTLQLNPAESTQLYSHILRSINDLIIDIDVTKVKSIPSLYSIAVSKHYICVALRNLAWALQWSNQKENLPEILDTPYLKLTNLAWSENDRVYWLQFVQKYSARGPSSKVNEFLTILNEESEKYKQRDLLVDRADAILKNVLPRMAYDAATHILSLSPLKKLFPDDMDYNTFKKNIDWFVQTDLLGYHTLSRILYQHFETVAPHFIQSIYSEANDDIIAVYTTALNEIFLNTRFNLVPRLACIATRVQDWIENEHKRLNSARDAKSEEDISFAKAVGSLNIDIIHLLLFLMNHKNVKIRSQAFEILYAFISVNFGSNLQIDAQRTQYALDQLAKLSPSLHSRSTASLEEDVTHCCTILASCYSFFTLNIINESAKRFNEITVPYRKLWVFHLLNPWCNKINFSVIKDPSSLLSTLFQITLDSVSSLGFGKKARALWTSIVLQGRTITKSEPLQRITKNLRLVIEFLLEVANQSKLHDEVCKSIASTMYIILPQATIDLLISILNDGKKERQDHQFLNSEEEPHSGSASTSGENGQFLVNMDTRHASIGFIADILAGTSNVLPIYKYLPVLLPYILVNLELQDDPSMNREELSSMDEEHAPHQNALLIVLLKLTARMAHSENIWKYIVDLLKSGDSIYVSWSTTPPSRINELVTNSLTHKYEDKEHRDKVLKTATHLLLFVDYHIRAYDLVNSLLHCVNKVVGWDILEHMATHCVQMAAKVQDSSSIFKHLTLYKLILEGEFTNSQTGQNMASRVLTVHNIQKILVCISNVANNFGLSHTTDDLGIAASQQANDNVDESQKNNPEFVTLIRLCLSLLKDIIQRIPIEDSNDDSLLKCYRNIFWVTASLLATTHSEIYSDLVRILTVYIQQKTLASCLNHFGEYTASWKPSFSGLQPLLLRGVNSNTCAQKISNILLTITKVTNVDNEACIEAVQDRRFLTSTLFLLPILYKEAYYNSNHYKEIYAGYANALSSHMGNNQVVQALKAVFSFKYEHPDQLISTCCAELVRLFFPTHVQYCAHVIYYFLTESEELIYRAAALKIASYMLLNAPTVALNNRNATQNEMVQFAPVIKSAISQLSASSSASAGNNKVSDNSGVNDKELFKTNVNELMAITFETSKLRQVFIDLKTTDADRVNQSCLPVNNNTNSYTLKPITQPELNLRISSTVQRGDELINSEGEVNEEVIVDIKEELNDSNQIQQFDDDIVYTIDVDRSETLGMSPIPMNNNSSNLDEDDLLPTSSLLSSFASSVANSIALKRESLAEINARGPTSELSPPAYLISVESKYDNINVAEEDIVKYTPSFEHLIDNTHLEFTSAYSKYAASQFGDEAIPFYMEVQDFLSVIAVTDRAVIAKGIMDKYIRAPAGPNDQYSPQKASTTVLKNTCISESMRSTIFKEYTMNVICPPKTLFAGALKEAFKVHHTTIYPQFLKSEQCKTLVKKEIQKQSLLSTSK